MFSGTRIKWMLGKTQNHRPFIKPGTRVVRGPDWNSGYEDNGEGFLGTLVIDEDTDDGIVTVIWDSGRRSKYKAKENQHDLRVYDTSPTGIKHVGVICHYCGDNPISGLRWKCTKCTFVNLCSSCYMSDQHDINHRFYRFDKPDIRSVQLETRSDSNKATARGLFIGAEVLRGPNWSCGIEDGFDVGYIKEIVAWKRTNVRGAVKVLWKHSEGLTTNRVGAEGCVDVVYSRLTENAIGGIYYPNHLPVVDQACLDYSDESTVENQACLDSPDESTVENPIRMDYSYKYSKTSLKLKTIKCLVVGEKVPEESGILVSQFNCTTYETIIGDDDICDVKVKVGGQDYSLQLHEFRVMREVMDDRHFKTADILLVCFPVVSPDAYRIVKEWWIPEIKEFSPKTPFLIVGTEIERRTDVATIGELRKQKQIPVMKTQGEKMALSNGALKYIEASTRTWEGLVDVCHEVVEALIAHHEYELSKITIPTKKNVNTCSVM